MTATDLTLKTDGEIYIATFPDTHSATSIHPLSEFPCYLNRPVKRLLDQLVEQTTPDTPSIDTTLDSLQTQLPRGDCHYALVKHGTDFLLEERQYDPYTTGNEFKNIRAVGYISTNPKHIHGTHHALTRELNELTTADAVIDRICNPDLTDTQHVKRIATNPPRPTLADYGIDTHHPQTEPN